MSERPIIPLGPPLEKGEGKKAEHLLEKKFFADAMLGKLARWMRTLGYDVEYDRAIDDPDLILRAAAEGRVILTRDTRLLKRRAARGRAVFIVGDEVGGQLRQAVALFPIEKDKLLTRCIRCNALLEKIDRGSVEGAVPAYVYETQDAFSRCPACKRVYWGATHRRRMLEDLRKLLG